MAHKSPFYLFPALPRHGLAVSLHEAVRSRREIKSNGKTQ